MNLNKKAPFVSPFMDVLKNKPVNAHDLPNGDFLAEINAKPTPFRQLDCTYAAWFMLKLKTIRNAYDETHPTRQTVEKSIQPIIAAGNALYSPSDLATEGKALMAKQKTFTPPSVPPKAAHVFFTYPNPPFKIVQRVSQKAVNEAKRILDEAVAKGWHPYQILGNTADAPIPYGPWWGLIVYLDDSHTPGAIATVTEVTKDQIKIKTHRGAIQTMQHPRIIYGETYYNEKVIPTWERTYIKPQSVETAKPPSSSPHTKADQPNTVAKPAKSKAPAKQTRKAKPDTEPKTIQGSLFG